MDMFHVAEHTVYGYGYGYVYGYVGLSSQVATVPDLKTETVPLCHTKQLVTHGVEEGLALSLVFAMRGVLVKPLSGVEEIYKNENIQRYNKI